MPWIKLCGWPYSPYTLTFSTRVNYQYNPTIRGVTIRVGHDEYVDCVGFVFSEDEFPLTNLHVPFLCEGMLHNVNSFIHVIGIKNQLIKG